MKTLFTDFSNFPVIETKRLVLRRMSEKDIPMLFLMRTDDDIRRYTDRPKPQSPDEMAVLLEKIDKSLEEGNGIGWTVTLKGSDEMIGDVSLWRIFHEHYRAETGYSLWKEYWGKGIAKEALVAILNYGFGTMNLHSVEANINPLNEASRGLLLSCGFEQEAYFRENYFSGGKFLDSAIYSLLEENFIQQVK